MSRDDFSAGVVRYGRFITARPRLVIAAVLLFFVIVASGVTRLNINDSYRVYFGPENPDLLAFDAFQDVYERQEFLLLCVVPSDGDVFSQDGLAAIERLTEAAWQIPYAARVESLSNFQDVRADGDDIIIDPLYTNANRLSETELGAVRDRALGQESVVNALVHEDGRGAGVYVRLVVPEGSRKAISAATEAAYALAGEVESEFSGLRVHVGGNAGYNYGLKQVVSRDLQTLIPVMFVCILALMVFMLRSLGAVAVTLTVIAGAAGAAMGMMGWLDISQTPPTAAAPLFIMTLAVADCVHVIVTYLHRRQAQFTQREAVVDSLRINFSPVFFTSITTAVGFLSLRFSDSPPFQDLGLITAIGVLAAFVLAVTFVPAALMFVPATKQFYAARRSPLLRGFANFLVRRHALVLLVFVALFALIAPLALRSEINEKYTHYFSERLPIRQALDAVEENLTGHFTIEYSLETSPDGVADPAYLRRADAFMQWWRTQPNVVHVSGLPTVVKRLNKAMHGDAPDAYAIPEDRKKIAQYLLLYEMSLPYGRDLTNMVSVDKSASRIHVALNNLSSVQVRDLTAAAETWLQANWPGQTPRAVSNAIMFAYIALRNISANVFAGALALVVVSLLLMVAFRSVKFGLLSIVPNVAPALLGYGLWGVLVGQIGLAASTVAAMSLGVVVDDTVHLMSRYLRARREQNLAPEDAVREVFNTVGVAVLVTTLMLMGGFMVLALSSYLPNATIGLLTTLILGCALLADFFLLPSLLLFVERRARWSPVRESTRAKAA